MPKISLSDMRLILLASANQRDAGNVLPVAASIANDNMTVRAALKSLLARALISEGPTTSVEQCWREDEDQRIGLFITLAGKEAIAAIDDHEDSAPDDPQTISVEGCAITAPSRTGSKQAALIERLRQDNGATIDELTAEFKWLPHTTRAVISGLRKKGYAVQNTRQDGMSRYRIAEPAA